MGNNREIRHKASRDFAQLKYHRRRSIVLYKALVEHMADAEDTSLTVDINDAPDADAAAAVSAAGGPPRVLLTGATGLIGMHILNELLKAGKYLVRAFVHHMSKVTETSVSEGQVSGGGSRG